MTTSYKTIPFDHSHSERLVGIERSYSAKPRQGPAIADISVFYNHEVQSIFALFLSNPDLYKDYSKIRNKQDYLFKAFRKFAANYYHFSGDDGVYFDSTRKESAGEASICDGWGKPGSSSQYLKNRYHAAVKINENKIDAFAKKYGVSFEKGNDPRQFLGVTEIWNHLDRANEIISASKWSNVVERSYSDASFQAPIPANLDKLLVPFDIRNRAMQKCRNAKRTTTIVANPSLVPEEHETPDPKPTIRGTIVIIPPEIDEDW